MIEIKILDAHKEDKTVLRETARYLLALAGDELVKENICTHPTFESYTSDAKPWTPALARCSVCKTPSEKIKNTAPNVPKLAFEYEPKFQYEGEDTPVPSFPCALKYPEESNKNLGDRPAVGFVDPNEVVEIPEHKHEAADSTSPLGYLQSWTPILTRAFSERMKELKEEVQANRDKPLPRTVNIEAGEDIEETTAVNEIIKDVKTANEVVQTIEENIGRGDRSKQFFFSGDLVTDVRGFPWDPRIHSRTESKTEDGAWKQKRGVSATLVTAVEKELMSHSTPPVQHPGTDRVRVDGIPTPVSINWQTPPPPAVPEPPPLEYDSLQRPMNSEPVPEAFLTSMPYPHTIYADDKAITIASPGAEPVIETVGFEEEDSYEDNMLWFDVMGRLTTAVRDKLITHAEVKTLVQSVGVESVPLLQQHAQVIPEFLQKLEHFLKTKGQS